MQLIFVCTVVIAIIIREASCRHGSGMSQRCVQYYSYSYVAFDGYKACSSTAKRERCPKYRVAYRNTFRCCDGWCGEHCTLQCGAGEVDNCVDNRCTHGRCVDGVDTYTCVCHPGWTGTYCDVNINECLGVGYACGHGFCVDGENEYFCKCTGIYEGPRCNEPVNYDCDANNPCLEDTWVYYFPHHIRNQYVQCDQWETGCFVRSCPSGLEWLPQFDTCGFRGWPHYR